MKDHLKHILLCLTVLLTSCCARRQQQQHHNSVVKVGDALRRPNNQDRIPTDVGAVWRCEGCSVTKHRNAFSGNHSWLVHRGRTPDRYAYTSINVESGGKYFYSAMVKMNQLARNRLWHKLTMSVNITYKTGVTLITYTSEVAILPYLRPVLGWQMLGGDFIVQDHEVVNTTIQIEADRRKLNFMIDNATLTQLRDDPDWKHKANERIEKLRKNNISFKINVAQGLDPSKVRIMVNMTKHDFPFGTCVRADTFLAGGELPEKYRAFFYDNYVWGVLCRAFKWKQMERRMGDVNYELTDAGLEQLTSHGVPVRGHTITWGVDHHNPDWLLTMNKSSVEANVARRMDYLLGRYRGRLRHWDVNNEDLHGSFFEEKTENPDYMFELFHEAHGLDPDAHLFTNDYNIVNSGTYTMAYAQYTKRMKENNVPIYGMGTQSHLRGAPDITLIQKRLELEASASLPIWITELDLTEPNISVRAQGYEDILRLYFSTPEIHGIVMWGYWDKVHWRPQAALVEGDDFHVNEAGARVIQLYKHEWSTNEVLVPTSHHDVINVRGFHGNYSLTVMYDGAVATRGNFYLHQGKDLNMDININSP